MLRPVDFGLEIQEQEVQMMHRHIERKLRAVRKRNDSTHSCSCGELDENGSTVTSASNSRDYFFFPPPPTVSVMTRTAHRSLSASSYCHMSDSDSQSDSGAGCGVSSPIAIHHPIYAIHRGYQSDGSPANMRPLSRFLPPIGVFWDIENCQVPKGRSAVAVAQVIRDRFFKGYREAEFLVVCDVKKESAQVVQELNDAQVNLIHVASTCKNAADEKLRQSIRRFADIHGSPATIILISGDINFAADLCDLRHRKKIHVILLHNSNTSEALILCASENYSFSRLVETLPQRTVKTSHPVEVLVSNLPDDKEQGRIKNRLKQLSDNCGGRVISINRNAATIRFSSIEFATRAQKRMHGEDVFGHKINVSNPARVIERPCKEVSPIKSYSGRKLVAKQNMREEEENHSHLLGHIPPCKTTPVSRSYSAALQNPSLSSRTPLSSWNTVVTASTSVTNHMNGTAPVSLNQESECSIPTEFTGTSDEKTYKFQPTVSAPFWHPTWSSSSQLQQAAEEKLKILGSANLAASFNNSKKDNTDGMRPIRGTHGGGANAWFQSTPDVHVGSFIPHQSRTPSPLTLASKALALSMEGPAWTSQGAAAPTRHCHPTQELSTPVADAASDSEHFFHPISSSKSAASVTDISSSVPVELLVTNLDQSMDAKEIRKLLLTVFKEHVKVLHLSVFVQSDGNMAAHVKVPSLHDAQYAISQLHRRKVGFKRILISHTHSAGPSPQVVKSQIVCLLSEVPGHQLPLFKFRELYESRYMSSVSMSELHKMRDVCVVSEEAGGRTVRLNPEYRDTPSPGAELPYCSIHLHQATPERGWAEQELAALPSVRLGLDTLKQRMDALLQSHGGSLPLPSLPACHEAQHGPLEIDEGGVPLEHLVSCLSHVEIYQGAGCVKHVRWLPPNVSAAQNDDPLKCISPSLMTQLTLFSRELIDLLRTSPNCQIPFSKFIPAYHHHFGRQCRVADYGFTKLIDLFEALSNVVQVMGEGNKRVVTLAHRAQVRRFTLDLFRVLKSQASKQVTLAEFPAVFQRALNRPFNIVDYGVCEIEDILSEIPDIAVVVTAYNDTLMISIPKREQTHEEIQKTRKFAGEVVELLRHAPQCRMQFNKFIPAYHHHFGRQCRVADYGFNKLIELFEAIPEVAKVEDGSEGERTVGLTAAESLRVLGDQVVSLVRASQQFSMPLSSLCTSYLRQFGYALRPEAYECTSLEHLMEHLTHAVQVIRTPSGVAVTLVDQSMAYLLGLQVRRVFLQATRMSSDEFLQAYWDYYNEPFDMEKAKNDLTNVIEIAFDGRKSVVQLTALQKFARAVYYLLFECRGNMPLESLDFMYLRKYGVACQPAQYGYPSIEALLRAIPETVCIRGKGTKKVFLNPELATVGIPLPENEMKYNPERILETAESKAESAALEEDKVCVPLTNILSDSLLKAMLVTNTTENIFDVTSPPKPDSPEKGHLAAQVAHTASLWGPAWNSAGSSCMPASDLPSIFEVTTQTKQHCWPHRVMSSEVYPPVAVLQPLHSSPITSIFSVYPHLPCVIPPDPSELPLPTMGSSQGVIVEEPSPQPDTNANEATPCGNSTPVKRDESTLKAADSADSNTSQESGQSSPNKVKRKRRLAAQFTTPMQLP